MSEAGAEGAIELRYELDAPPEKVWRAVTVPALRERWLPGKDFAEAEALEVTPEREVSYRIREAAPPFLESTVTFHVEPGLGGRTSLRVIHRLTDPRIARTSGDVADGTMPLMLAA